MLGSNYEPAPKPVSQITGLERSSRSLEELAKLQTEELSDRELRKVKNRVAASNYRRLENNMSLLIQLAFSEALLDWEEINEGPAKYEAVTADDIKRVANKYFNETNRSVAIYRRNTEQVAAKKAIKKDLKTAKEAGK